MTATLEHQGKSLGIDCAQETVSLFDRKGHRLGVVGWGSLIDHILSTDQDTHFAHCRSHPRASLAIKVHCITENGKHFDTLTSGIGGGGMFIESSAPLPPGTNLKVEFSLPDKPNEKLEAEATVAWTRTRPERYLLFPGMGIQFTGINQDARERLIDLVTSLNRNRASA
ncbi:MAG: PilZ domain-containing protein [Nitrospirales bacterium]|nr:PilZ domain-containing protein [Nitrospirales bacterium]